MTAATIARPVPVPPVHPTRTSIVLRAMVAWLMRRIARLDIAGLENVPTDGSCLLVFNQLSVFDTALVSVLIPRHDVTGLVALDYRRNLFYRVMIEAGGGIWIQRNSSDHTALKGALTALKRGWAVGISPEGQRSRTGGLVSGRPGAAFLAKTSRAPIVPTAFTNVENLASSLTGFKRARITVRFGEPFCLPPFDDRLHKPQLLEGTETIMCRLAAMLPPKYRGVYADHPQLRGEGSR